MSCLVMHGGSLTPNLLSLSLFLVQFLLSTIFLRLVKGERFLETFLATDLTTGREDLQHSKSCTSHSSQ